MIILVIDDCEDMRELTSYVIKEEFPHCQILEAEGGQQGAQILSLYGDRIQAIVCDYHMPKGSGEVVFQEWKINHGHIPYILYSSDIALAKGRLINNDRELLENPRLHFVEKQDGIEPLFGIIKSIPQSSFLKLPLTRFRENEELVMPVYVSLNNRKLVKHTHENDILDGERLVQLKEKGLDHFYVPYERAKDLGLRWPYVNLYRGKKVGKRDLLKQFETFKELHRDALDQMMKSSEKLESGFYWLEFVISSQDENKGLQSLLSGLKTEEDYVIHHSMLVLLISYLALREIESNTEACRSILFYGILFHDILKSNDEAYQVDIFGSDKTHSEKTNYYNKAEKLLSTLKCDNDSSKVLHGLVFGVEESAYLAQSNHKLAQIAIISHQISNDLYRQNFLTSPMIKQYDVKDQLKDIFINLFTAPSF